ncbi:hypothetical protein [Roseimaritima ulvae]|uniref:O-Antigen ligase n=1 Tax=Roseimaritima ulvae TaxID=980254 RepID=A0A5B9QVC4_9BACT|nr:hypothetical protein [Roseimaritima ulvae]QEG42997.1 hypothetical protein UC8_50400 [Roseimaritima ulvae]
MHAAVRSQGSRTIVRDNRIERLANACLDFTIFALLLIVPLLLGGRHPVAKWIIACITIPGCLGLAVKVLLGRSLRITIWQAMLVLACLCLPLIQLLPVGSDVTHHLAPGIAQRFDLQQPFVAALQVDRQLSLAPKLVDRSFAMLICYIAALLCVVGRIESQRDVERIMAWLGCSALLLAVLAMLQAHYGNGRFLWWYDHPAREPGEVPRGPFQNENHLCSLLALALPSTLYFLLRSPPSKRQSSHSGGGAGRFWQSHHVSIGRLFALVCLIVVVATVYDTPSRGGAAIVMLGTLIWATFLALRVVSLRYFPHHIQRIYGLAAGGLAVLVAAGFWLLLKWLPVLSHWRYKLWAADIQVWRGFPIFGTGLGTHRFAYRAFVDEHYHRTFSTAESSWITLLVESGLTGVLLAAAIVLTVVCLVVKCVGKKHTINQTLILAAISAGVLVSSIHSIADFPWYIPACLIPVLALVAIATQMPHVLERHTQQSLQRRQVQVGLSSGLSLVMSLGLLIGTIWSAVHLAAPARAAVAYDQYRRLVRDTEGPLSSNTEQSAFALLEQTIDLDPHHVLARSKLAVHLLAQMDQPQTDPQATALAAVRQGLELAKLCPMESRAYFVTAVAGGRLGVGLSSQEHLLQQAQRLRPVDGRVSLQLAVRATAAGDVAQSDKHWRAAIDADPRFRKQALSILMMLYTPEQIIERFDPGRDASALLYSLVRNRNDAAQTHVAARHFCLQLLDEAEGETDLLQAKYYFEQALVVAEGTDDPVLKLQALTRFLQRHPGQLSVRLKLVDLLVDQNSEQDALKQLKKCQTAAPRSEQVSRVVMRFERHFRRSVR